MTTIVVDGFEYTVRPGLKKGIIDTLKPYEGTKKAVAPPEKPSVEPEVKAEKTKKKAEKPKKKSWLK